MKFFDKKYLIIPLFCFILLSSCHNHERILRYVSQNYNSLMIINPKKDKKAVEQNLKNNLDINKNHHLMKTDTTIISEPILINYSINDTSEFVPVDKEPSVDLKRLNKMIKYSANLIKNRIQEKIIIRLLIDSKGTPVQFKYDNAHSIEFIEAIKQALFLYGNFEPALKFGRPVSCWISVPVYFLID